MLAMLLQCWMRRTSCGGFFEAVGLGLGIKRLGERKGRSAFWPYKGLKGPVSRPPESQNLGLVLLPVGRNLWNSHPEQGSEEASCSSLAAEKTVSTLWAPGRSHREVEGAAESPQIWNRPELVEACGPEAHAFQRLAGRVCRREAGGCGQQHGKRAARLGAAKGQLTACAAWAGTETLTFPQTGSGYHRSVWKKKTQTPNPVIRPFQWGPRQVSGLCFLLLRGPPQACPLPFPPPPDTAGHRGSGEVSTHMVCSRGLPMKAFSGMALMLLLWKPLEGNRGGQ